MQYELIGDRGYEQSDCPELLAKVRRFPSSLCADDRLLLRVWHSVLERGRVLSENAFARIAQHKLVGRTFRGALQRHAVYMFLAASITQLQLLASPLRSAALSEAHACVFDAATQGLLAHSLFEQLSQQ